MPTPLEAAPMPLVEMHHYSVLFILGIGAFAGILGAWLFQKMRIPQVVGYIAVGLIIGESGFKLVTPEHITALAPFNKFALGIIGFLVGGELQGETFKKYGRQFAAILLGEGLMAFFLVGISTGLVIYFVIDDVALAVAAGIVFGAISSATDPASTIDVLWEYRAKGILTTSIIAIVALDDALAMTLYGIGKAVATILGGSASPNGESASILNELLKVGKELGGAVVVGVTLGLIVNALLRRIHERDKSLALFIGTTLMAIGVSVAFDLDVILSTMALGLTLTNLAPRRSQDLFALLRSASIPVYVLFFVLVGARLSVGHLPGWLWLIVGLYVFFRNGGKMLGAYLGARWTGADPAVRKYLGMGIFAQGGVAVGLSMLASEGLREIPVTPGLSLGDAIIFAVTATTLIVQVIGPPMVKLAAIRSGEAGRNVTEEDIIQSLTVDDVMQSGAMGVHITDNIRMLVDHFSAAPQSSHPVMDKKGKLAGMVTFESLREVLPDQDTWEWIVAADIMQPTGEQVRTGMPLRAAMDLMNETHQEEMIVTDAADHTLPRGLLETRRIRQRIHEELLRRSMGTPA